MYARLFAAGLALLLLAGCASMPNPFAGPSQASTPSNGAPAAGTPAVNNTAPVNPLAGVANSSDPRVATLASAGGASLGAAAVGGYMDQEEAELRTLTGSGGISVTRAGQQIVLTLPAFLTFDADKSVVKPALTGTITSIGQILKKYNKTLIDVYGYSDAQTPTQHGRDLSQRRAVAVATILSNAGPDQHRFYIEGRGALQPVASNATEVGRAQNRRVEIQISPIVAPAKG